MCSHAFMDICIHMYIHIHMYMYVCVCVCVSVYVCVMSIGTRDSATAKESVKESKEKSCACVGMCVACARACVRTCMRACVHVCVRACVIAQVSHLHLGRRLMINLVHLHLLHSLHRHLDWDLAANFLPLDLLHRNALNNFLHLCMQIATIAMLYLVATISLFVHDLLSIALPTSSKIG